MAYNGPKITDEELILAVAKSNSMSEVLRLLNRYPGGTSHRHYSKRVKELNISTKHFVRGQNGGGKPFKTANEILINNPEITQRVRTNQLRRAMLEVNVLYVCQNCNMEPLWNNKPITLEIDHIDGLWQNNELSNLRFLCPNCHSQTETFGNRVK